ncbi:lasso peptide biosynthesis B2 protein [Sphingorhabdus sp.]|jgi:hypothetical protein|uniref:lasso peptide biosynthesis B2 protein n=2 Tax=Sphingorhabdus sp. TaxID=1902408 RepID=UPI003BB0A53F
MCVLRDRVRKGKRGIHFLLLGAELCVQLGKAAWTVRFVPFKDYGRQLKDIADSNPPPLQLARDIRRIVNLVSPILPERSNCLICGIAAKRMFARRGYGSELSFGVDPAATPMVAHAWLVAASIVVTGKSGRAKFSEVVRL